MNLFNTPTETGLRCLMLLTVQEGAEYDIDRLIYFDYFLLYPSDSPLNINNNLHSKTPYRAGELAVKRNLLSNGLLLMIKKGLIDIIYADKGVCYRATSVAKPFLSYFQTRYFLKLKNNAELITNELKNYSQQELEVFINSHIGTWGAEFTREFLFRTDENEL
jgi:hypothetical protein